MLIERDLLKIAFSVIPAKAGLPAIRWAGIQNILNTLDSVSSTE